MTTSATAKPQYRILNLFRQNELKDVTGEFRVIDRQSIKTYQIEDLNKVDQFLRGLKNEQAVVLKMGYHTLWKFARQINPGKSLGGWGELRAINDELILPISKTSTTHPTSITYGSVLVNSTLLQGVVLHDEEKYREIVRQADFNVFLRTQIPLNGLNQAYMFV